MKLMWIGSGNKIGRQTFKYLLYLISTIFHVSHKKIKKDTDFIPETLVPLSLNLDETFTMFITYHDILFFKNHDFFEPCE